MEDRNNSGVLFKNDRKEQDKHPDYKGHATLDGVDYYVSSWVRTSKKDGGKFMSLAFSPKGEQKAKAISQSRELLVDDDDIPF
jgi:hypothetical protein